MNERRPIQVADLREEPAYRAGDPLAVTAANDAGIRTFVSVPMYKDDQTVGNITISVARFDRSPTSRSSSLRTSRLGGPSPSRMRGCSIKYANAPTI